MNDKTTLPFSTKGQEQNHLAEIWEMPNSRHGTERGKCHTSKSIEDSVTFHHTWGCAPFVTQEGGKCTLFNSAKSVASAVAHSHI